MKDDLILRVVGKLMIPFILLFALYVQFHGDLGPGGGFQAGVIIAGGHTINDQEPKYGLSVTGLVDPHRMYTNDTGMPGDKLVLTKALGVGLLCTANRVGEAAPEEMEAAIRAANAQAEKTLRDAKDASADYVQKAEKDVTTIAMSVVEKVLPQHFIDVPQVILPLVREAILKVKDQKELLIHVPPASYGLVLMARDEFRSLLTYGDATLEVLSDDSMQPGDCLVETPNGSVDARLATQIEMLKQAVKDVML